MKRFGDFLLVSEEELKKNKDQKDKEDRIAKAKDILKKACMNKEKLADPNEFSNDPKNQAAHVDGRGPKMDPSTPKKDVSKDIAYTNKKEDKLKSLNDQRPTKKSGSPDPMLMSEKKPEGRFFPQEPEDDKFRGRVHTEQGSDPTRPAWHLKQKQYVKAPPPKPHETGSSRGAEETVPLHINHDKIDETRKSNGPQSFAQMKKAEAAKKNDPAVSGTKIESQQSGELGNKAKAKDDSVSPLKSEPKKEIAEVVGDKYAKKSEVKKSMKEGGSPQWSQNDLMKGLAVAMGGSKIGATEMPNPSAQPLIPKQKAQEEPKSREVPLLRALADMDDSKVKV